MKNIPNWIPWLFAVMVTIGGWVYTYATLNARVDHMERQLEKVNVEVLQIQMEHNKKMLDKIESKVDKIFEAIME